jgi:hypothetical protein
MESNPRSVQRQEHEDGKQQNESVKSNRTPYNAEDIIRMRDVWKPCRTIDLYRLFQFCSTAIESEIGSEDLDGNISEVQDSIRWHMSRAPDPFTYLEFHRQRVQSELLENLRALHWRWRIQRRMWDAVCLLVTKGLLSKDIMLGYIGCRKLYTPDKNVRGMMAELGGFEVLMQCNAMGLPQSFGGFEAAAVWLCLMVLRGGNHQTWREIKPVLEKSGLLGRFVAEESAMLRELWRERLPKPSNPVYEPVFGKPTSMECGFRGTPAIGFWLPYDVSNKQDFARWKVATAGLKSRLKAEFEYCFGENSWSRKRIVSEEEVSETNSSHCRRPPP